MVETSTRIILLIGRRDIALLDVRYGIDTKVKNYYCIPSLSSL